MSRSTTRYLIVNADDFGYSFGINKGIVEAHVKGIVTSTSVMVDGVSAHEATALKDYPDLSVGLHLELKDLTNVEGELQRQIAKFVSITGRQPTHIDTHKRHTTDEGIQEVLQAYCAGRTVPIRNLNSKHIGSFGINSNDTSTEQLRHSIDEATDDYNELMTHCGYSDEYLEKHSSYSKPRESELHAMCDPAIMNYITKKNLTLINWSELSVYISK